MTFLYWEVVILITSFEIPAGGWPAFNSSLGDDIFG